MDGMGSKEVNLDNCRVVDLKAILRTFGLSAQGNKAELRHRVLAHVEQHQISIEEVNTALQKAYETAGEGPSGRATDMQNERETLNTSRIAAERVPDVNHQEGEETEVPTSEIHHDAVSMVDTIRSRIPSSKGQDFMPRGRSGSVLGCKSRLGRAESVVSVGSSRSSSASSLDRRREAAVKYAKMKAVKEKKRLLLQQEAAHRLLEMQIEENEIEAEEQEWRRQESNVGDDQELSDDDEIMIRSRVTNADDGVRKNVGFDSLRLEKNLVSARPAISATSNPEVSQHRSQIPTPLVDLSRETSHSDLVMELVKCNDSARLPKRDVQTFGGKIESFALFKIAFQAAIGSCKLSEREKLHYLYQFTTDIPREIIESCIYLAEEDGYARAWELLEERYGSTELIGAAHIQKLWAFPDISAQDPKMLDKYAIAVVMAGNAMSRMPSGQSELNNHNTIRRIVAKLPNSLQERWNRFASKIRDNKQRVVTFEDLAAFIKDEARVANDPIYGKLAMKEAAQHGSGDVKPKRAMVWTMKHSKENCAYCGGEHKLGHCEYFAGLSHSEKIDKLKGERRCFMCLERGHSARMCEEPRKCERCSGWHNTVMHREYTERDFILGNLPRDKLRGTAKNSQEDFNPQTNNAGSSGATRVNVLSSAVSGPYSGQLPIIPVSLYTRDGEVKETFALLDSGSAVTMCKSDLLSKLGVKKKDACTTNLTVITIGGECKMDGSFVEGLIAANVDTGDEIALPPVFSVRNIPIDRTDSVSARDLVSWRHLRDIDIREVGKIEMIIGTNAPQATEPLEVIGAPNKGEPYAIRTRLGWTIHGIGRGVPNNPVKVGNVAIRDLALDNLVQKAFDVDFRDVGTCDTGLSGEDARWMKAIENGCRKVNNQFEIPLPLRTENLKLPHSRHAAVKRLYALRRKLLKDDILGTKYTAVIEEMVKKGYAEKVPDGDICDGSNAWYVPHFSVSNPQKPEKTRVVFDCAARVGGVCLNDFLMTGPTLGNDLLDVLLRFRLGEYAYTADIEAMYYQVKVPEKQRNYMRFLWYENYKNPATLREFRVTVHMFGACSSPSVATFALQEAAKSLSHEKLNSARDTILQNFYVDDLLKAGDSEEELIGNARDVRRLCWMSGFNLTKFRSEFHMGEEFSMEGGCEAEEIRALGIMWNLKHDILRPSIAVENIPRSRRTLLSLIASIYDPLGILAPLLLMGRVLLQDSFRRKSQSGWDDTLGEELQSAVEKWTQNLKKCLNVNVPRNCLSRVETNGEFQLHLFSDASSKGYCAVAYVRSLNDGQSFGCRFIWGKARVNPLKDVSIPRLELTAAVLASNMGVRIRKAMKIEFTNTVYWTDSMVVLRYIRNDKDRFNVFVANRLTLIKERTKSCDWKYVPSADNPADDGTRCAQTERWGSCPSFLMLPESCWPQEIATSADDSEDLEIKAAVNVARITVQSPVEELINYFSSWYRLKVAVAWWMTYKRYLLNREINGTIITSSQLLEATFEIIRFEQSRYYRGELDACEANYELGKKSCLWRLNVFVKDGVLRVGGRLGRLDVDWFRKYPIIIPSESHIAKLIILESHERLGHLGAATVLSDVRQMFWIIRGHSTVRRILRTCVTCRRTNGKTVEQKMADLPVERIQHAVSPFTNTGVDCFGPFVVKIGRRTEKRYGILFTCLAMRAVHLEVACDLTTDCMCNAIRRFMARRGTVRKFLSDNGTNFIGARKEIMAVFSSNVVKKRLLCKNIDWEMNPPGASHFGGSWERLIGVVRRVLESMMRNHCLTDDGLRTLFCEVEVAVNSRPLTVVSSDARDLEAITPNKLLSLGDGPSTWEESAGSDTYSRKRWKQIQHMADTFWKRWTKEYRVSLQERQKWTKKSRNLVVGDIVLLVNETEARCHWPLGRIVETTPSQDGLVRSVNVLANGKIYRRPVVKLVLLVEGEELL